MALSSEQAISRLEAGAATQFDSQIVRVFVRHIREKGYDMVLAEPRKNS
jgi:HD-GYP domain-containing protein (c-di-GMP phosphodiesterase class II)